MGIRIRQRCMKVSLESINVEVIYGYVQTSFWVKLILFLKFYKITVFFAFKRNCFNLYGIQSELTKVFNFVFKFLSINKY